ncbi:ubiquinol-cytochrome c reductase cytochrome c1 subunit [Rhodoferax antarcticus]|uniref:Cytochrome c1 n=1 Tax=Rhodoferax antarcticus ANT.BR TaxID=1111071 RepID=A0A1Q8YKS4_9BURK|nr:ubiquinol-cytochrome c reductase cytochrome c1 subunit [Rhodoferax antarcticus]OLP08575.1 cytochrome c1 [Rhodoferax antarcticus ANT.BR]
MKTNMIKKITAGLAIAMSLVGSVYASEGGVAWDKAPNKITDMAALQNGAKTFSAYCLGCHGAEYMRYNRLEDIGFTLDQIKSEIVNTDAKVGDTMRSVISPKEGKTWFGVAPPDLSVIARSRAGANGSGADYLYTYLRSFYRDPTSPTGYNNSVFLNTGMPNVFWEQQGDHKAVFEEVIVDGNKSHHFKGFEQMTPGSMNPEQFDQMVGDLVNYLQWMGEPVQSQRKTMGIYVLIFLAGFIVVAWRLNKSYWKDIK